jgi:hypothetical protein
MDDTTHHIQTWRGTETMNIPWGDYSDGFEQKQGRMKKKKTEEQLVKHKQSCVKAHSKRKKK